MIKKLLTYSVVITTVVWSIGLLATPLAVGAAVSGDLVKKATSPAVYYVGADGKRYSFPSADIYKTWYSDFSGVKVISDTEFNELAWGGNVFPRPGVKLVQFVDGETPWNILDPKIYAVAGNGTLRHITSAAVAVELYGSNWESKIVPVVEILLGEYSTGAAVEVASGYDKALETENASTVNADLNLTEGIAVGSSLKVDLAADTPASGMAVGGAARIPFTKINLTASADGAITIDTWQVKRMGLAQDGSFASIDILDASTMMPINTTGKTFTSLHTANFTEDFTIPAGTTKSVYLAGNMNSQLTLGTSYAGEAPILALNALTLKGNSTVVGTLPVAGHYQTINGTIVIGNTNVTIGAYSNAINASLEVGKTAYTFLSFQITPNSTEDVSFSQVRVYQAGSASLSNDLANIKFYQDGTELATGVVKGNYVDFSFSPITLLKGQVKQFLVKADVINGTLRTIQLGLYRQQDLLVKGLTYNYNITTGINNSAGSIMAQAASATGGYAYSATSPVLVDNRATISTGTLRVGRSNTVGAENITVGSDQVLGAYEFEAKGEPVIISALTLTIASSTTGATIIEDALQGVKLVDKNGVAVAGPTDITNNTLTVEFTDTFTVPVGLHVYKVVGNVYTGGGWITNNTIWASLTPSSDIIAKGEVSSQTINSTPGSPVTTATQTIKAANLTVSKNSTPADKIVVAQSTGVLIGSWDFDATNSGENIRITTISVKASSTGKLNNLTLKDGSTSLSPVNDPPSGTPTVIGTPTTSTWALSEPLIITKGTSKTINLYANIASDALAGEVDRWGITSDTQITAYGVTTGNTAVVTVVDIEGANITIADTGTLTFVNDPSNLPPHLVVAGTTGEVLADIRVEATNENIDITSLTVYIEDGGLGGGTGSYSQLSKFYLKLDGSIIGATAGYNANAASVLVTLDKGVLNIPQGRTGKKLSIVGDIVQIGDTYENENFDIKVGISDPTTGVGVGSNAPVAKTWTSASGSAVMIHKAVPQVVIAGSGSVSDPVLHRVSVTAVGGAIGLWRLVYQTTTTTGVDLANAYTKLKTCAGGCGGVGNGTRLAATVTEGIDISIGAKTWDMPMSISGKYYLMIAQDATAVIELFALVSGTTNPDKVSTSLLGDAATSTNETAGDPADTSAWTIQNNGHFIWSPLHVDKSQEATSLTSKQWYNSYLVSGLDDVTTTATVVDF